MRLINTRTRALEEFIGSNIPKYAILSHTWEEEEVTYKDMTTNPHHTSMRGHGKIEMTCRLAAASGLEYAWVDTCCIDKSSSAELSEAINSMYQWYERSAVCYGYLSDLKSTTSLEKSLWNCRWFTRGWTLQELIAPQNVLFFDSTWECKGSKHDLVDILAGITGIHRDILEHNRRPSSVPVAQRMAWAAHRQTTRIEDRAYSLLGIFGVNMAMLYGEEEKAFRRLQEEIIRSTSDLSIFAWKLPASTKPDTHDRMVCGLLATSPDVFVDCLALQGRPDGEAPELIVTNNRVKTQAPVFHERSKNGLVLWRIMMLGCSLQGQYLGVRLRIYGVGDQVRLDPWDLFRHKEGENMFTPEYTVSRHILASLPSTDSSPSENPGYLPESSFLAERRRRVLQIWTPGSEFRLERILPLGRCHVAEQLVFASSNLSQDACIISFRIAPTSVEFTERSIFHGKLVVTGWGGQPGRQRKPVPSPTYGDEYVTAWEPSGDNSLQFTILDSGSGYARQLGALVDQISGRENLDAHYLMEWMNRHNVPRVSSAVFTMPDNPGCSFRLVFTPWILDDQRVCKDLFWRLHCAWEAVNLQVPSGGGAVDHRPWEVRMTASPGFDYFQVNI